MPSTAVKLPSPPHRRKFRSPGSPPRPTPRLKAQADIEIARWKARQWAEIERYKAGLNWYSLTDDREQQVRRTRVATEMKAGLESLIETYEADARLRKRREHTLGDRPRRQGGSRKSFCVQMVMDL